MTTSLGISWLVYPLHRTGDLAVDLAMDMVDMVEVKGRLETRSFTFIFLADSDNEEKIKHDISSWLVRYEKYWGTVKSGYTFCGEMELMNPEQIFAPGNSLENWRLTRIRAHCPQNVGPLDPRSIVVVHGEDMSQNVEVDI